MSITCTLRKISLQQPSRNKMRYAPHHCKMRNANSVPPCSPLGHILQNWMTLSFNLWKRKSWCFLIPLHSANILQTQRKMAFNYSTTLQLDLFWKQEEKWKGMPYVQSFIRINLHKEYGKLWSSRMGSRRNLFSLILMQSWRTAVLLFDCLLLTLLPMSAAPSLKAQRNRNAISLSTLPRVCLGSGFQIPHT